MTGTLSSWTIYCFGYLINAGGEFSLTYGWNPRAYRWGFGVTVGVVGLKLQIYTAFAQPYVALPRAALCRFHFTVCVLKIHTVITYQMEGGSLDRFNRFNDAAMLLGIGRGFAVG